MNIDKPLDELLSKLYMLSGEERPRYYDTLRIWLGRLSSIADFRSGGKKRRALARKVTEYLELAEVNKTYRDLFFSVIDGAAVTCGDRMALSVIHLGLAKQLAEIDLSDMDRLAKFITSVVWPIDQLEKIAREKVPTLGLADEIEVYLGYLIKLKDRLDLPLDVQAMLFFNCSNLSKKDLDSAYQQILANCGDFNKQCNFLAHHDLWRKALEKKEPQAYERAMDSEDPIAALAELTKQIHKKSLNAQNTAPNVDESKKRAGKRGFSEIM